MKLRTDDGENEYLAVAQITAFGSEPGSLKLKLLTDFPERFRERKIFYIDFFGSKKELAAEEIRGSSGEPVIKFRAFSNREESKILLGKFLLIPKEDAVALPENSFFIHDLIGSEVIKDKNLFGIITDVYSLRSNDVYVIRRNDGSEYLLPAVKEYVLSYSPETKKMIIKGGEEYYDED